MRPKNTGFTLVELIIVIVILGIVSVIAIPKVQDLRTKALIASEDAIIGALKSAILLEHSQRIINGITPQWFGVDPAENPLNLLTQPPPYKSGYGAGDGTNWYLIRFTNEWYIYCPHFNWYGPPLERKGRVWAYTFRDNGSIHAGDFRLYYDPGH